MRSYIPVRSRFPSPALVQLVVFEEEQPPSSSPVLSFINPAEGFFNSVSPSRRSSFSPGSLILVHDLRLILRRRLALAAPSTTKPIHVTWRPRRSPVSASMNCARILNEGIRMEQPGEGDPLAPVSPLATRHVGMMSSKAMLIRHSIQPNQG